MVDKIAHDAPVVVLGLGRFGAATAVAQDDEMLDDYVTTYFNKAWGHFDVNQTGFIEVIKMPQFMRFLCSDQYMSLGESG